MIPPMTLFDSSCVILAQFLTYNGFSGEIDIMEARGNDPSYPFQCVFLLYQLMDNFTDLRCTGGETTSAAH